MSSFPFIHAAFEGELDPSLVGLLAFQGGSPDFLANDGQNLRVNVKTHADALAELEAGTADLAVVTLDRLVEHTSRGQETKARILGLLLGGDSRGFVELQPTPKCSGCRLLGSVNPEMAHSRWEDLSCGLDINSDYDVGKRVSPRKMDEELFSGRFGLMELNMYWEGLLGFRRGIVRRTVWSRDFGLPHGFSHVLVVNSDFLREQRECLVLLRERLRAVYEALLTHTQSAAEVFAHAKTFDRSPSAAFLQASFRILAPHFESFLDCSGKLDWSALSPYVSWFQARVAHKKSTVDSPFTAIQLEHLLCDAWS